MNTFKAYGNEVITIFQLIGYHENDITKSIAWAMHKCPAFLEGIVFEITGLESKADETEILYQDYDPTSGITDIEITDHKTYHLIIEAKKGWELPKEEQLTKYSKRNSFIKAAVAEKVIVSMSECTNEYAVDNLPFLEVNGIPVKHISWKTIYQIAEKSSNQSNHEQKRLLKELKTYLRGIMTMQTKDSNWVYVVSLGSGKPERASVSWIDIVYKNNRYFHPVGGQGWPKEPPNYIAFRFAGKLQSIHHIEDYIVSRNMHDEIDGMPDEAWNTNHFIYKLGPAIVPSKEVKTGNIYPNGRVWAMLDTLLTSDTISEARDISKHR